MHLHNTASTKIYIYVVNLPFYSCKWPLVVRTFSVWPVVTFARNITVNHYLNDAMHIETVCTLHARSSTRVRILASPHHPQTTPSPARKQSFPVTRCWMVARTHSGRMSPRLTTNSECVCVCVCVSICNVLQAGSGFKIGPMDWRTVNRQTRRPPHAIGRSNLCKCVRTTNDCNVKFIRLRSHGYCKLFLSQSIQS